MKNSATSSLPPKIDLRFDHVCLSPHEQIGRHWQESWELSYVCRGSGQRTLGDHAAPFSAGDLVLIPPEIPHHWQFEAEGSENSIENITLCISDYLLVRCAEVFPILEPIITHIRQNPYARSYPTKQRKGIIRVLETMTRMQPEEYPAALLQLLPLLADDADSTALSNQRRYTSVAQERLAKINTYVVCNYMRPISLADIARHVGMSRAGFCTFFRRVTGKRFVDYLNAYRLQHSCRLLEQTSMSTAEIAFCSGFSSVPCFYRVFHNAMKVAPGTYRSQRKN